MVSTLATLALLATPTIPITEQEAFHTTEEEEEETEAAAESHVKQHKTIIFTFLPIQPNKTKEQKKRHSNSSIQRSKNS
ncbi:hypothetical protein BT63DRAFT_427842 [Microthyrium microscopicum]|uniref:Uncharacterized protein n=1 Tax=Microthyrium microscopicum TaxID=703497 RepID=A0A6A6U1Q9_9PEZI|nr:hypothetical protein BT63DRAFT_427842 [Microthyrium microscopicum]